ncbi:hypothetical protein HanXRQr2_Chr11g0503641 [Helianthus annuus]|uniref:Uncharacterized protein n=1 Tax=Helianthus annuus TaxID=4232 RepID=A0A9K3HRR9_HELAN|nr:hypothetical protein HanXRQr2_Chr11g0503641 [Helianthus annuus]
MMLDELAEGSTRPDLGGLRKKMVLWEPNDQPPCTTPEKKSDQLCGGC